MQVTSQGCVKSAARPGSFVLTQVTAWPIVRKPEGAFGPWLFAAHMDAQRLAEFVGDTLQLTGRITRIRKSEIETEPGLHRFGTFVAIERPEGDILVRPRTLGVELPAKSKKDDISITLIEYDVSEVLRVMTGCLPQPGAPSQMARRN